MPDIKPSHIRVLLVDDHRIVREGVRALLRTQPDIEVVGEAENGRIGVELAARLRPNVVVMDISMPDLNGVDATLQILKQDPSVKVLILSAHADQCLARSALEAGATALIPKDAAFDELILAIRASIDGRIYINAGVAGHVVGSLLEHIVLESPGAPRAPSPREREVLQLMAEGLSTKEIARHLDLSTKTVETHRRQMMEKLKIYSVAELTRYAVREGLTPL